MRAPASGRALHNVPAELTSFVGRRQELAQIKERLSSSRLVTLIGPAGVGKPAWLCPRRGRWPRVVRPSINKLGFDSRSQIAGWAATHPAALSK